MLKPNKILIIRFSALGDLVLTTPIFREMKKVFPDVHISLLTSAGDGSVLKNNPYIDHIIWHKRSETYSELKKLIIKLKKENYDLVYDAHRSLRSIWIVWNLNNFGLRTTPNVWLINKRSLQRSLLINFKLNFLNNTSSQRKHLLLPLQKQTSLVLNDHTELFPDQKTVTKINNFLLKNKLIHKKYIAIGASASYPLKRWPLKYFKELISMLINQDCPVVLVGGENETENVKLGQEFSGKVINAAGNFTPLESAELLKHARIVVTNDTSISHLAEAMLTPVLVFFGATVKEFGYSPFLKESKIIETSENLSCRPCSRDGRGKCSNPDRLRCLTSLTPEMAFSIIPELNYYNSEKTANNNSNP